MRVFARVFYINIIIYIFQSPITYCAPVLCAMTKRDIEATQPDGTTEKESKMTKATQVTSLLVKKLCPQAQLPARGSAYAAGYDLFSVEKKVIGAGDKALIDLGISISVPAGTYGRVAPRSGLAAKHHIHTGAGVIDADYRGRVFVLLFNLSQKDFESGLVLAYG